MLVVGIGVSRTSCIGAYDVIFFHEDDSRIRKGYAPENMTLMRKIALNLLSKEPSKGSEKAKRLKADWDNDFLIQILLA